MCSKKKARFRRCSVSAGETPFAEPQHLNCAAKPSTLSTPPQFGSPDANLGDGTLGQVIGTQIDNREPAASQEILLLEDHGLTGR
jgi:hypothetical protein